jgi:GxxExxY protein
MPITSPISIRPINQEEFARIDYQVMRHAFDSQNELGRLCDEVIYQNDLAARLESAGLGPVRKEVPVTVTHGSFVKTYSLDMVVADAAIYEVKTAAALIAEHDAQVLNYLFLHGAQHGKLVNFRPAQVESKFVNTTLTAHTRREFVVDTRRWRESDAASQLIRERLLDLLKDWGGFLELPLYTEALTHFLGGEETVLRMIPLARDGLPLGNQRVHMLASDMAFRLTALPDGAESYEPHLRALLRHSRLRAVQWINMSRHRIEFVTLTK